jgi:V/A-type H+-transporting ATPase subunit D
MVQLKVSPTRSNLLSVRQRLRLAHEGHDLLVQKRDVLVIEILRVIQDAERIQSEAEEKFKAAYAAVQEARAAMGTERVWRIALSRAQEVDVHIRPRSIMGVVVPSVICKVPDRRPRQGFGDTPVALDQAQREWASVLALMGELAERVTTVWRLALELQRTQRRVNALEYIFIPSYEETLKYIQDTLEEKDREELFQLKRSKARLRKQQALSFDIT